MSSKRLKSAGQMQRSNLEYSEELYRLYLQNPNSVEDSWRWFFQGMSAVETDLKKEDLEKEIHVFQLIQAYRDHGSLKACLDPLGLDSDKGFPSLDKFHLTKKDLNKSFLTTYFLFGLEQTLEEVLNFLNQKYCGTLALQVGGCHPQVRMWFFNEFESTAFSLSPEQKKQAFYHLASAEILESFLHFNFLGKKRFSIEGLEVLMPALEHLIEQGPSLEMRNLVIGMAHRGRINTLINTMKQDPKVIFSELDDHLESKIFDESHFTGDVKYHLGFSSVRKTNQNSCQIHLAYNPSHLEAVNPVVCGMTRALQRKNKDTQNRKTVVPVLIHGDGAFCGQGSTSETLQLSQLKGYTVGGCIHIILNNQVGFTTSPQEGRSTLFTSDLAKSIKAPVLLVNGDHPESALRAMDLALRFRYKFGQDVFIEMVGYRKYGHNEGDEPSFTQPLMYKKIKQKKQPVQIYKEQLLEQKILTEKEVEQFYEEQKDFLEQNLKTLRESDKKFESEDFTGDKMSVSKSPLKNTQTTHAHLTEVMKFISEEPSSVNLHPKLKKILAKRRTLIEKDQLDWGLCELLSYGTLLKDGFSVRLTGQDSKRGTFSHRHAIYYDYEKEQEYSPLKQLIKGKNQECCLYNSPLSEMAVLAFEYGNSCLAPDFLTLWEAQFGDFANGAQIIIDQFISSGEMKWLQQTDITLLLPHGYEGQGPEHSSAYLERFLQLCAQQNIRVCNLTTPANFFHALRRQKVLLKERKPLVIMTPKSLLRDPEVFSSQKDLLQGQFEEVLWDEKAPDPRDIQALILCSGKVYYDLKNHMKQHNQKQKDFAIFRLEQLYPFPTTQLNPALNGFPQLKKVIWLQEESKNRGAWSYVRPKLENMLIALGQNVKIQYVGRAKMAASAEGSEKLHKKEQERIMRNCLSEV